MEQSKLLHIGSENNLLRNQIRSILDAKSENEEKNQVLIANLYDQIQNLEEMSKSSKSVHISASKSDDMGEPFQLRSRLESKLQSIENSKSFESRLLVNDASTNSLVKNQTPSASGDLVAKTAASMERRKSFIPSTLQTASKGSSSSLTDNHKSPISSPPRKSSINPFFHKGKSSSSSLNQSHGNLPNVKEVVPEEHFDDDLDDNFSAHRSSQGRRASKIPHFRPSPPRPTIGKTESPTFLLREAADSQKLLSSLDSQIQDIEGMFS